MFVPNHPRNVHVLTRESSLIPYSSILERERSQYNSPATCVVAQQYSPFKFISLHFHSHKANSKRFSKPYVIFCFWNYVVWNCINSGMARYRKTG